MMDVVISSGWRSGGSGEISRIGTVPRQEEPDLTAERFVSRHGRYEVTISQVPGGWKVEYTSTGRLFGPRVCLYEAVHAEARHAAWDVMCRVIRATDDENTGVMVGKNASAWLMEHTSVC